MNVEQSVEYELAGETKVLQENLHQCHFVYLKTHMIWPGIRSRADAVGNLWLTA
jgi:hypothetical protein